LGKGRREKEKLETRRQKVEGRKGSGGWREKKFEEKSRSLRRGRDDTWQRRPD